MPRLQWFVRRDPRWTLPAAPADTLTPRVSAAVGGTSGKLPFRPGQNGADVGLRPPPTSDQRAETRVPGVPEIDLLALLDRLSSLCK